MTPQDIVVWTPGNNRIWWACPTCKVEAGITLTASAVEVHKRLGDFLGQHKDCSNKETTWRKSA